MVCCLVVAFCGLCVWICGFGFDVSRVFMVAGSVSCAFVGVLGGFAAVGVACGFGVVAGFLVV